MLKIAIIAGEPSGDLLASDLMSKLKKLTSENIEFLGIGGKLMQQEGLLSSYPMHVLAVGGFGFDLLFKIPQILYIRFKIIKKIIAFKPDVFIGVDAPDFNFYVEKKLKLKGIRTIHYVSPSLWAWRYDRIYSIKRSTDLVLCLFPFEESIYKKAGINAKYVGHMLADKIELDIDSKYYKEQLNVSNFNNVFTVLTGSRVGEVKRLAKVFIAACAIINKHYSDAIFLFPFSDPNLEDIFLELFNSSKVNFNYKVLLNETLTAIKASDMVLAKSGTVTLEVALSKKPMIISYILSSISAYIVRKKMTIKYVGQPNIILNEEVVPEIIQEEATAENLAKNFIKIYDDKEKVKYIVNKFYELHNMLMINASYNAAKTILEFLNNHE